MPSNMIPGGTDSADGGFADYNDTSTSGTP